MDSQELFQVLVNKSSSLQSAWRNSRACQRRFESLCINAVDDCFWFYAKQHIALIAHFVSAGKLLLDGKLLFSHQMTDHSQFICGSRSGSYESFAEEHLDPFSVMISVPLTKVSVDYFVIWMQKKIKMKVCVAIFFRFNVI